MTKAQEAEKKEAREQLREWLKPGDTVYTVLRHVSRSGMLRVISLHFIAPDDNGQSFAMDLTRLAAKATGMTVDRDRDGIRIQGCGMDMGFELVYQLGRALWPEGFAPGDPWRPGAYKVCGIRPEDGKLVNVNFGRGKNAGPMRREELAAFVAKGWTFPNGRNGDTSGWDNDGGYALRQRWI